MSKAEKVRSMINNLTQDIIEIYKLDSPIRDMKDIYEVVKRLGGRIEECANVISISNGSIKKEGNGFVIYVLSFQNTEQKKHAIAHELGHLFLHMGYETDPDLWKSQENATYYHSGDPLEEYHANEFAAALLMPQMRYKEVMDENTEGVEVDTEKIAKYFGVSVSVASNRGKVLGYLQ